MHSNEIPAIEQNLYTLHRPDWSNWKTAKSMRLWHAVALACDLDPYQFTVFGVPTLEKLLVRTPRKFDDLLALAKSGIGGGLIKRASPISEDGIEETEITPSSFGAWVKSVGYSAPIEFPWQDDTVMPLSREWPWGGYETELLRKLALAANRFWRHYDPLDPTTAPTNKDVIAWLVDQGVASRTAEIMATILRVDGLPTGPRK